MSWSIEYLPEAKSDLQRLDNTARTEVAKGIRKVAKQPDADGYGKPLGNTNSSELAGLYKIKFKRSGLRVVYALQQAGETMNIIIISAREDNHVYKEAQGATPKNRLRHVQDNRADIVQRYPIQGLAGIGNGGHVGKAVPQCL